MAFVAAILMSATVMAQDGTQQRRERRQMDSEQMAQRQTEHMVKTYGLNEEQAAKLLELNKKSHFQMRPEGRQRPHMDSLQRGQRPPRMMKDSLQRGQRPMMREGGRGPQRNGDFRKQMEEYDNALKEILTEEQYKAYQTDRQKRMKDGPRPMGEPANKEKHQDK